jgi:hypothetical protein
MDNIVYVEKRSVFRTKTAKQKTKRKSTVIKFDSTESDTTGVRFVCSSTCDALLGTFVVILCRPVLLQVPRPLTVGARAGARVRARA